MNRFIRISLAVLLGFAAPLQAFGWGTVTGPRGGTATTGPRGGGYAQGPNGAAAVRGPYGGAAAVGPNGGTAYRPLMEALAMALRYIVVRYMPAPFTGHMSEHPITVQSSRA
jgi:hypothetical protein